MYTRLDSSLPHGPQGTTLLSLLVAHADSRGTARAMRAAAVVFVTVLTAAAAQISVPLPFSPVPFTFQPMIVLVGAAALGARAGMSSQILYLAAGLAGLPVFAASPLLPPGAARLFGPTGGYLLAYPVAAFLAGWLAERGFDRRYLTSVVAMVAGLAVVYLGGVAGLMWLQAPASAGLSLPQALALGVVPFAPADIVKLLVAAAALPGLWRLTGRASA